MIRMSAETVIAGIGLIFTILVNIIAVVIFLTRQSDNLKFLEKTFENSKKSVIESVTSYQESMTAEFEKFKEDLKEKIKENQEHTNKHIERLEEKQNKHNNLIERMVIVEQSTKSAHKRIDEIKDYKNEYIK